MRIAYQPHTEGLFVKLSASEMARVTDYAAGPAKGFLFGLNLTVDGSEYRVLTQGLGEGGQSMPFELSRRDSDGTAWEPIATIKGGYGTIGRFVVFALPLSLISYTDGSEITGVMGFTAVGGYAVGPARILDSIALGSGNWSVPIARANWRMVGELLAMRWSLSPPGL